MGAGASASLPISVEEALAAGYSPEAIREHQQVRLEAMGFSTNSIARALREQPTVDGALSWLLENPDAKTTQSSADRNYDGYYDDYKTPYGSSGEVGQGAAAQVAAAAAVAGLDYRATRPAGNPPLWDRGSMAQEAAAALLSELVSMGFSASAAALALRTAPGGLDRALGWLLEHPDAAGTCARSEPASAAAAQDSFRNAAATEDFLAEPLQKASRAEAEAAARRALAARE